MKPRKTWVLVADGARARILQSNGSGGGLSSALNFNFAMSHAPSRDFGSDKPGRGQGAGGVAQHTKPPKVDWHTYEKHLFAKELAKALEEALRERAFDDLVLVAPPKALGELRQALANDVMSRVKTEIGKDLTHLSVPELDRYLEDAKP